MNNPEENGEGGQGPRDDASEVGASRTPPEEKDPKDEAPENTPLAPEATEPEKAEDQLGPGASNSAEETAEPVLQPGDPGYTPPVAGDTDLEA